MNSEPFRIRAYSKQELGRLYFPDVKSAHTATNRLMSLVNAYDDLMGELEGAGYQKTCKFLTPRQVAIIVDYLGEP